MYHHLSLAIRGCFIELVDLLADCDGFNSYSPRPLWLKALRPIVDIDASNRPLVVIARFLYQSKVVVLESNVLVSLHFIVHAVMKPRRVQHRLKADQSPLVILQLLKGQTHLFLGEHDHDKVAVFS